MQLIRDIVWQALETGYLTIEAENRLRKMLKNKYSKRDLEAFMTLQKATMAGQVKQQSRDSILT
jgi:hypothetical protein